MNNNKTQKAVFLDRDGVINRCAAPHCYISKWEEFEFLPGAVTGIKVLNEAGYLVLLVSNQRGVARGLFTLTELAELNQKMCEKLQEQGAHIDGIYICSHNEGECGCRKPNPGLFFQAELDWKIDKEQSWCVGDSESDIQAGKNYGIKTILIGDSTEEYGQTNTFPCLEEASAFLASMEDEQ